MQQDLAEDLQKAALNDYKSKVDARHDSFATIQYIWIGDAL